MYFRVALLLWLLDYCSAQDANCDFNINITVGETYYLKSPNYPKNYTPGVDCRWTGVCPSGYRCHLACSEISLPRSLLCNMDRLLVSRTGDRQLIGATTYCGLEKLLNITSIGQSISIGLKTNQSSTGGRLSCQLTAQAAPSALSALSALTAPVSSASCSCGRRRQNRIVGGQETGVNEYPMMAGLLDRAKRLIYCGGVIITEKFVLTAAACAVKRQVDGIGVLVGDHDITTGQDTSAATVLKVVTIIKHPYFNESNTRNDYDIAVVVVDKIIGFSDRVGPVCLPFRFVKADFAGRKVTALGWGLLKFGGTQPNVLMKANLDVLSQSSCRARVPSITDRQICTFTPGKGFCQQDIGGPLLYTDPITGRLYVVGIMSNYTDCATNEPGINTRVTELLDWIVESTQTPYCVG